GLGLPALILSNCTGRKRQSADKTLCARSLSRGGYRSLARQWSARIDRASKRFIAKQLYCGRVVTETLLASDAIRADIVFISAGLGVVAEDAQIPSYSLTSSPGSPDSIAARLTQPYEPGRWWRALNEARGAD